MQNTTKTPSWTDVPGYPATLCQGCFLRNSDWARFCGRCGRPLPNPRGAAAREMAHIVYLLTQLGQWRVAGDVAEEAGERLQNDYTRRLETLSAEVAPPPSVPAAKPVGVQSAAVRQREAQAPRQETAAPQPPSLGESGAYSPNSPKLGGQGAQSTNGLKIFLQEHALKLVFALAAVMVLVALRSMLAWDWVDALALRLVPLVPLGLGAMFWTFGQKTRRENPWAAFVYHGLTAVVAAFSVIALNKYWLGGILTAKLVFLAASVAATALAGGMLLRWKEIPYLHLFQIGAVTSLYGIGQSLRVLPKPYDFAPTPLVLFGGLYLAFAALCLLAASCVRSGKAASDKTQEAVPNTVWAEAYTFWAHLAVTLVVILAAVSPILAGRVEMQSFAALAAVAGILYGAGAQALGSAGMARTSSLFFVGGGAFWLLESGQEGLHRYALLLLALSAASLALSAYNRKSAGENEARKELAAAYRQSAQVVAAVGLVLAALLPLRYGLASEWAWTAAAMTFGAVLYGFEARQNRSSEAATAALFCAAYASALLTWYVLPRTATLTDCLAPFTLLSALAVFALSQSNTNQNAAEDANRTLWREPTTALCLLAAGSALAESLSHVLAPTGQTTQPLFTLLPCLVSTALVTASRREAQPDAFRTVGIAAMCAASGLEIFLACGITAVHWTAGRAVTCGLLLVALGWAWWLVGLAISRRHTQDVWSEELQIGGLATAFVSVATVTLAAVYAPAASQTLFYGIEACFAAAFALYCAYSWRAEREGALYASLVILLCAGDALRLTLSPATQFAFPSLTLFALTAAGAYVALARRLNRPDVVRMSLLPLIGGYLFLCYPAAILLEDGLWTAGGLLFACAYLHAARWSQRREFTFYFAWTLLAATRHGMTLVWDSRESENWYALLMLPCFGALYLLGDRWRKSSEDLLGEPTRKTALMASTLGLFSGAAYGLLGDTVHSAWVGVLTLCCYAAVYTARAFYRQTPRAVSLAALAWTFAYLFHLQTRMFARGTEPLTWPLCAFYFVQAGVFWLVVGWHLRKSYGKPELAAPLLRLAGAVSLASALLALYVVQTPHEGKWSILTLGWAGAVCFGLWLLEQGELWLHVGTWNLLAAWGLIVYDHVGADMRMLDLYLLPVGLYLLTIGQMASGRKQAEQANALWYGGLLLMLSPAFFAYWERAEVWHTLLLLGECLGAVLWGIGQRIRAFVTVGLGFAAAYAASAVAGQLPDTWGTIGSLLLGVALFVAGFYALTHRETVQRWMAVIERQWQVWQAWR